MKIFHGAFCGMFEFAGLSGFRTPEGALRSVRDRLLYIFENERIPYVLFSGTTSRPVNLGHATNREDNYGAAFAAYLEQNKLGKIIPTTPRMNWTNNPVQMWVWEPDHDAVINFLRHMR